MLRAVFDLQTSYSNSLSFQTGSRFVQLETSHDRNWLLVVNETGSVGYVPKNYVQPDKGSKEEILEYISRAKEQILSSNPHLTGYQKKFIKLLTYTHKKIDQSNGTIDGHPTENGDAHKDMGNGHDPVLSTGSPFNKRKFGGNNSEAKVTPQMIDELIELVRVRTDLSNDMSRYAIATVVDFLGDKFPKWRPVTEDIINRVAVQKVGESSMKVSNDVKRLRVIFSEIQFANDDEEQRNWALYKDEDIILEYLGEMLNIVGGADKAAVLHALQEDKFEGLNKMVLYFQKETRNSIRLVLLELFGALCGVDRIVGSILLNSVLLLELATDILDKKQEIQRASYSALLMTMLMANDELLLQQQYEYFTPEVVASFLEIMDNPPEEDVDYKLPEVLMDVLLALNLHYPDPMNNVLMDALRAKGVAKTFTEKLLLLLNKGEDHVSEMFDRDPPLTNSVIKAIHDILSDADSADVFYVNDVKVLIDIVVRQLYDLSPFDESRRCYLEMMQLLIVNTQYEQHKHSLSSLKSCFESILKEDLDASAPDRHQVAAIVVSKPDLFGDLLSP